MLMSVLWTDYLFERAIGSLVIRDVKVQSYVTFG